MANIFDDIDQVVEALDDKVIRTEQGAYISVDDLKEFQRQVKEMKEKDPDKPKITSWEQAKRLAKEDPRIAPPPLPPVPPALSGVKGVTGPQEESTSE